METEPISMGQSVSMDSEAPVNANVQEIMEDTARLPGAATDVVVKDQDIVEKSFHPNNVQHNIPERDKDASSISLAIPKKAQELHDDSVPDDSGLGLTNTPTADGSERYSQELTPSNETYPEACSSDKKSDAALDKVVDVRSADRSTELSHKSSESLAVNSDWTDVSPRRRKRVAVKTVIRNLIAGRDEAEDDGPMQKKARDTSDLMESSGSLLTKAPKTEPKRKKAVTPSASSESKKKVPASGPSPKATATSKKPEKSPARTSAKEVWSGPPTEPLEGGWPDGWIKKVVERQSGGTAGSTDRYWYSPMTNKKFRSMVEIKRFFKHLESCGGDEDIAWRLMKTKQG